MMPHKGIASALRQKWSKRMGRFDGVDLGGNATLQRQIRSTVRRRHDDLNDAIVELRNRGFNEAACVIEAMIEAEKKEVGLT